MAAGDAGASVEAGTGGDVGDKVVGGVVWCVALPLDLLLCFRVSGMFTGRKRDWCSPDVLIAFSAGFFFVVVVMEVVEVVCVDVLVVAVVVLVEMDVVVSVTVLVAVLVGEGVVVVLLRVDVAAWVVVEALMVVARLVVGAGVVLVAGRDVLGSEVADSFSEVLLEIVAFGLEGLLVSATASLEVSCAGRLEELAFGATSSACVVLEADLLGACDDVELGAAVVALAVAVLVLLFRVVVVLACVSTGAGGRSCSLTPVWRPRWLPGRVSGMNTGRVKDSCSPAVLMALGAGMGVGAGRGVGAGVSVLLLLLELPLFSSSWLWFPGAAHGQR